VLVQLGEDRTELKDETTVVPS